MLVNGGTLANVNVKNVNFSKKNKRYKTFNVNTANRARYLVDKFKRIGCDDAGDCYKYFIKCFQTLPEDTVWSIYETATSKTSIRSPIKYFIGACRNQMHN